MLAVQIKPSFSVHLFFPLIKMGTNKCASQAGMTAYGTRRHLYDPKMQTDKPFDQTTISLQMGTNKGASQVSRTACDPGTVETRWGRRVPEWRAVAKSNWQQQEGKAQLYFYVVKQKNWSFLSLTSMFCAEYIKA